MHFIYFFFSHCKFFVCDFQQWVKGICVYVCACREIAIQMDGKDIKPWRAIWPFITGSQIFLFLIQRNIYDNSKSINTVSFNLRYAKKKKKYPPVARELSAADLSSKLLKYLNLVRFSSCRSARVYLLFRCIRCIRCSARVCYPIYPCIPYNS